MNPKKEIFKWIVSALIFTGILFLLSLIHVGIEYLFNHYRERTMKVLSSAFYLSVSFGITHIIKRSIFDRKY